MKSRTSPTKIQKSILIKAGMQASARLLAIVMNFS